MAISLEQTVVRDEEPIAATVDGEVFMLSPRAQSYFGLGDVGSEIWHMITSPRRVSDICAELVEKYDVTRELCELETLAFLDELLLGKLIRIVGDDASRK